MDKKPTLPELFEACGPTVFKNPMFIVDDALDHTAIWAKWEGRESEDQLRERLRAHWPKAVRANIDHAIERQFHPERRN